MAQRVCLRDATGGRADDHSELDLPVELLRDRLVVLDRIAGPITVVGGLEKITGCFGRSFEVSSDLAHFGDMLDIVQPDAEDVLAGRGMGASSFTLAIAVAPRRSEKSGGYCRGSAAACSGRRAGIDQAEHVSGRVMPVCRAERADVDHQVVNEDA